MIQLDQRSYTNGHFFRPKPVVVERAESHLIVISTPWGSLESAQKAATMVVEQFELLSQEDLTTPFERITSISPSANRLRVGALIANQHILKNENVKTWKTAVELAAIHYDHHVLSWVQIGSPHILIRQGDLSHPLAYEPDWGLQSKNEGPLFSQALGLDPHAPLRFGSMRIVEESTLVLLSRGTIPRAFYQRNDLNLDLATQEAVKDNPEAPFWMGLAQLD